MLIVICCRIQTSILKKCRLFLDTLTLTGLKLLPVWMEIIFFQTVCWKWRCWKFLTKYQILCKLWKTSIWCRWGLIFCFFCSFIVYFLITCISLLFNVKIFIDCSRCMSSSVSKQNCWIFGGRLQVMWITCWRGQSSGRINIGAFVCFASHYKFCVCIKHLQRRRHFCRSFHGLFFEGNVCFINFCFWIIWSLSVFAFFQNKHNTDTAWQHFCQRTICAWNDYEMRTKTIAWKQGWWGDNMRANIF
jgi:hypothetical protein